MSPQEMKASRSIHSSGSQRPYHDVKWSSKCVFVMCGLPGRGKSHIGSKIISFLTWRGLKCQLFNVGKARREECSDDSHQTARFFDHSDQAATRKREQIAYSVLDELLDWLEWEGGSVAVFDATNTTARRRMNVFKRVHRRSSKLPVVFVESICDDEEVLLSNYLVKCTYSPDYKDMPLNEALADLKTRIDNYARVYQTVDNDQLSYIKLFNLATKVICNRVHGEIPILIAAYLMSVHIRKRPIYLTRAGEPSSSANYVRSFRARTRRSPRPSGRSRSEADMNSGLPSGHDDDDTVTEDFHPSDSRIVTVPEHETPNESGQDSDQPLGLARAKSRSRGLSPSTSMAADSSVEVVSRDGLVRVDTFGNSGDPTDITPLTDYETPSGDPQEHVMDNKESDDEEETDPVLAAVAKVSASRRHTSPSRSVAEFSDAATRHRASAGHARRPQTHLKSMIAPLSERGEQYAFRLATFIRSKCILYQKRVAVSQKNQPAARKPLSKSRRHRRSNPDQPIRTPSGESVGTPQIPRTPRNASPGNCRFAVGGRAMTPALPTWENRAADTDPDASSDSPSSDDEAESNEEGGFVFDDPMTPPTDLETQYAPDISQEPLEKPNVDSALLSEGPRTPSLARPKADGHPSKSRSTSPPQATPLPTAPLSSPNSLEALVTTPIGNQMKRNNGRLPVAIYCSTLPRAEQTVVHIPADVLLHSSLNSFNTGVFHGMTTDEILSTAAGREQHKLFLKNPYIYRYPGGDSLKDVALSMESLVMDIERHTSPCLVVSHSNTLKVLYSYFLGSSVDPKDIHKLDIPPHTVIELIPALYGYVERRYSLSSHAELQEHLASVEREAQELEQEQAKRLRIQELLHKHPLTSGQDRDFLLSIQGLHASAGSADIIERLQNQLKSLAGHEHEDLLPSPTASSGQKHGTQFYH